MALEMDFCELQEERPGFAHDALLDVEVGEFFERTNLFGSEFGDALVNGDGLGQETVAYEDLRQTLKIIDGLKSFALADVELADGHQGDLVFGLVLEDLLVFRDGLRDLALVQELLRGFDVFAFAIGHSLTQTQRRPRLLEGVVLAPEDKKRQAELCLPTLAGREKTSQRTQNFV